MLKTLMFLFFLETDLNLCLISEQCFIDMETSQLICAASQITGLYTGVASVWYELRQGFNDSSLWLTVPGTIPPQNPPKDNYSPEFFPWIVFGVWLTDKRRLALFPEILTIANLWHAVYRTWTCAEPEFSLWWMKLLSSDSHNTAAPE